LIAETGDVYLLAWYTTTTAAADRMYQQLEDTEKAEAYKEEVKLEIVNSAGSVKLLELQIDKEAKGELIAMDNMSMNYTEAYTQFILNNYLYVVAAN